MLLSLPICIIEADPRLAGELAKHAVELGFSVSCITDTFEKAWRACRKQMPGLIILGAAAQEQTLSHHDFLSQLHQIGQTSFLHLYDHPSADETALGPTKSVLKPPYTAERVGRAITAALPGGTSAASPADTTDIDTLSIQSWPGLGDRIFIRNKQVLKRVFIEDIAYVQADNAYIHIHAREQTYTVTAHLGRFEQVIRHPLLLRIHRSYMVNLGMIESVEANFSQVNLYQKGLPVSNSYREALKNQLRYL